MFKKIAHRLRCRGTTENSLESLQDSLQHKITRFETDVQLSKDKVPFLMHDKLLDRTTNGSGFLADFTAAELQSQFVLSNGEPIPSLTDLLATLQGKQVELYLELISFGSFPIVYSYIKETELLANIKISSFCHRDLLEVKNLNSAIKTMALLECEPVDLAHLLRTCRADEVGFGFDSATARSVAEAQRTGVTAYGWTVNSPVELQRAQSLGFDGVFSDYIEE